MSDTPRTDAATVRATQTCLDYSCTKFESMVPEEKAKELERELNDALAKLSRATSFDGVMDFLRSRYPSEVFDGSSGDAGAMVAVLAQRLEAVTKERDEIHDRMRRGALASDYAQRCFRLEAERDSLDAQVGVLQTTAEGYKLGLDEALAENNRLAAQVAELEKILGIVRRNCQQKVSFDGQAYYSLEFDEASLVDEALGLSAHTATGKEKGK